MNLLYLSYGSGSHEQEVIFSVLSVLRWASGRHVGRILIYTDHPDTFQGLPVQVQFISSHQWNDWAGPNQFNHRRKILAMKHVFDHHEGAVVLLDGDTWLRAPASRLFDRVSSGHAVMHIREGRISEIDTPLFHKLGGLLTNAEFQNTEGRKFRISPESMIYNAGVVGLDPSDAPLLDEVLTITDQLCSLSDSHILEQLAFSYVLSMKTRLNEADDLVFHYWPPYLHVPFRAVLPKIMAESTSMSIQQRGNYLFAHRPRPTWLRRGKVVVKRVLQMAGFIRGGCRSNEW